MAFGYGGMPSVGAADLEYLPPDDQRAYAGWGVIRLGFLICTLAIIGGTLVGFTVLYISTELNDDRLAFRAGEVVGGLYVLGVAGLWLLRAAARRVHHSES
jgi:hypothetical protein